MRRPDLPAQGLLLLPGQRGLFNGAKAVAGAACSGGCSRRRRKGRGCDHDGRCQKSGLYPAQGLHNDTLMTAF
jgi:hypothetical protein